VILDKFAEIELQLNKDVKKGDKESLLSLFNVAERFKYMDVLKDADEGTDIKLVLEDLGEADVRLGADMEKGQKKTIMTLFWYDERSKPMKMKRNAKAKENITINIWET
jgi:hypothetical protein